MEKKILKSAVRSVSNDLPLFMHHDQNWVIETLRHYAHISSISSLKFLQFKRQNTIKQKVLSAKISWCYNSKYPSDVEVC